MTVAQTRLAGIEHARALAQLQIEFNAEFDASCPTEAQLVPRFTAILESTAGYAVLLSDHGALHGYALVTLRPTIYSDGPLAVLDELYVRPDQRSRGFGTAILSHALREMRDRGGEEMHINVDEADADARRFYERHGFMNTEPGHEERMLLYLQDFGAQPRSGV
ncbi:GNAT family N-acetyltransferase [Leucobacter sp. GX24907]